MTDPPERIGVDTVLTRRSDVVTEDFDDAVLLWDDTTAQLHHLDLRAALVWDAIDGRSTLGDVAVQLAADFRTSPETLTADLVTVANRLAALGLVTAQNAPQ